MYCTVGSDGLCPPSVSSPEYFRCYEARQVPAIWLGARTNGTLARTAGTSNCSAYILPFREISPTGGAFPKIVGWTVIAGTGCMCDGDRERALMGSRDSDLWKSRVYSIRGLCQSVVNRGEQPSLERLILSSSQRLATKARTLWTITTVQTSGTYIRHATSLA